VGTKCPVERRENFQGSELYRISEAIEEEDGRRY